jgi:tRNA A37 N6-isopentenylltransferase MiaA
MKKKVMVLALAGILTVSGASFAYGASRNNTSFDNFKGQMMSVQNSDVKSSSNYRTTMMVNAGSGAQSNDNYNKMIEIMKDNGFADEANAMTNRDFDAMNKLMTNISDDDYKKMIDIMQNNGYGSMAKMMQSVSREDMIKFHKSMMGR